MSKEPRKHARTAISPWKKVWTCTPSGVTCTPTVGLNDLSSVETSPVAKVSGRKSQTWWSAVSRTLRPSRVSCMGESLSLDMMESTGHSPGRQVRGSPHGVLYSPSSITEGHCLRPGCHNSFKDVVPPATVFICLEHSRPAESRSSQCRDGRVRASWMRHGCVPRTQSRSCAGVV
jgi:hypothetical protein